MIEMRKLQRLGKVELLELVQELTEELDELHEQCEKLQQGQKIAPTADVVPPVAPPPGAAPAWTPGTPTGSPTQAMGYYARSVQEVFEAAQKAQQEMEAHMARIRQDALHREEEARQVAQIAMAKSDDLMHRLTVYRALTEESLQGMADMVASLQQAVRTQVETAHSEYDQLSRMIEKSSIRWYEGMEAPSGTT